MKTYVFVPGSFHGSWSWMKMQELLEKKGHRSAAIDLPGQGDDNTPPGQVQLDDYVNKVCQVLDNYDTPVVLVGHSRAGIVISQVAERMPGKIKDLVYLCAYLIPNGEPMVATALTDERSVLANNLVFNEVEGWHFPKDAVIKEAFYNDCSDEDVAFCVSRLKKEPIAPVATPLQLSPERYGTVPKTYIHTTADNSVTYELQQRMVQRLPVNKTFIMNASHSPFMSQPEELAGILDEL